jgi:hypothetical protein
MLFTTLLLTAGSVVNIGMLMTVVFFIAGVTGMHLFAHLPRGELLNGHENFETTPNAMKLLFEVATGHDFLNLIHEMNLAGALTGAPFIYFTVFYVIASWMLVNLFVAVLLENIQVTLQHDASEIDADHAASFKSIWVENPDPTAKNNMVTCQHLFDNILPKLEDPFDSLLEMGFFRNRLLLELGVPLTANRTDPQYQLSFGNVLMSLSVLYLSAECLPYEKRHERTLKLVSAQQQYATRLIACKWREQKKCVKLPETWTGPSGKIMQLDTDARKAAYRTLVRGFSKIVFRSIVVTNKLFDFSHEINMAHKVHHKTGRIRLKVSWLRKEGAELKDPPRILQVHVIQCTGLKRMDLISNDVYVHVQANAIGGDSMSKKTPTINSGGKSPDFQKQFKNGEATLEFEWPDVPVSGQPATRVIPTSLRVSVYDEDMGSDEGRSGAMIRGLTDVVTGIDKGLQRAGQFLDDGVATVVDKAADALNIRALRAARISPRPLAHSPALSSDCLHGRDRASFLGGPTEDDTWGTP